MIRINLLPQAKKQVRAPAAATGTAQGWTIGYLVAMVLWGVALAGVYIVYSGELDEQNERNRALDGQIQQLMTKSAQLEEYRAKLAASVRLEELVAELDKARQGPTRVLMELSKILSPGPQGGPTIDPQALEALRRDNPLAGYNRSWDPRRLWVTEFREENRACQITGAGKTNEDVAEFLRRLALSEIFEQVTLTKTLAEEDASGLTVIEFELTCRVRY